MTFQDDMRAMPPEAVRVAIVDRLRDGAGQSWNEAQGEPVWALLVSAFQHWRITSTQLQAVDAALAELVPSAFASRHWAVARDACEFASALVGLPKPWIPISCKNWPFEQWLHEPGVATEKLNATVAALRLMCQLDKVQLDKVQLRIAHGPWLKKTFRLASQGVRQNPNRHQLRWLLECWKAVLGPAGKWQADRGDDLPWFDLLAAVSQVADSDARLRYLESALGWAWSASSTSHRNEMATAAFKAVLDLRDQSIQAELCKAVEQAFSSADGVASTATMTKHILKFRIGHQDAMQGLRSPDAANDQRWSSQCLALV